LPITDQESINRAVQAVADGTVQFIRVRGQHWPSFGLELFSYTLMNSLLFSGALL